MKTQFNSRQHNVSKENLEYIFPLGISNVDTATLHSIAVPAKGYGYYDVLVNVGINGINEEFRGCTSNMQTIDAWKSGEEFVDTSMFDSWADVVYSLLWEVGFEDKAIELAVSSDEIRPNAREILIENYERSDIALEGLSLFDWVDSEMDGDPTFEAWLFYKAENVGYCGSSMTKRQKEALDEFLASL